MSSMYHSGELEVQTRVGVREMADRIGKSIRSSIPPAAQEFLRRQPFAVIGSKDERGRVWASVLTGPSGFLQATADTVVQIRTKPVEGDPLNRNWLQQKQIGMLAIELSTRQRMRVNGIVEPGLESSMMLNADEVFSNCQKYIQARTQEEASPEKSDTNSRNQKTHALTQQQQQWIERSDTFFIASSHPDAGTDVSHRGGFPGFVHIKDANHLVWPDYTGNMMFQTLGNIAAYPFAGLLFIDFERGNTLQLTGKASILWDSEKTPEAERHIEFSIEDAIEIQNGFPIQYRFQSYSQHNPPVNR